MTRLQEIVVSLLEILLWLPRTLFIMISLLVYASKTRRRKIFVAEKSSSWNSRVHDSWRVIIPWLSFHGESRFSLSFQNSIDMTHFLPQSWSTLVLTTSWISHPPTLLCHDWLLNREFRGSRSITKRTSYSSRFFRLRRQEGKPCDPGKQCRSSNLRLLCQWIHERSLPHSSKRIPLQDANTLQSRLCWKDWRRKFCLHCCR
jgi:hypothetical protein